MTASTESLTSEAIKSLATVGFDEDSWGWASRASSTTPPPFPRVNQLRNWHLDECPYTVDSEGALLITEAYQANADDPQILKSAKALAHILANVSLQITDGQPATDADAASTPAARTRTVEWSQEVGIMRSTLFPAVAVVVALVGCGGDGSTDPVDESATPSSVADSVAATVAATTTTMPAPAAETTTAESTVPESTVPESTVPESTVPESTVPETAPATTEPPLESFLTLTTLPSGERVDVTNDPGNLARMCVRVFDAAGDVIDQRYCTTVQRATEASDRELEGNGLRVLVFDVPVQTSGAFVTVGNPDPDVTTANRGDGTPVGEVELFEFAATKKFGAIFLPTDASNICMFYDYSAPVDIQISQTCLVD